MHHSPRLANTAFGYQTATYLVRRGGVWQYRRRIPKCLVTYVTTTEIRVSTKARDRTEALRAAAQISAALEAQWSKLIGADAASGAGADFQAAITTAETLGVTYRPAAEIAASLGAGISVDAPSSIPAAAAIVAALSDWLGDGDPQQVDRARRAMTARGNNPYALVRFEQVWQTLDSIMPGISRALESLELFGSPNENHHALAEVLTNGGSVITTNFDRRVEWALEPVQFKLKHNLSF